MTTLTGDDSAGTEPSLISEQNEKQVDELVVSDNKTSDSELDDEYHMHASIHFHKIEIVGLQELSSIGEKVDPYVVFSLGENKWGNRTDTIENGGVNAEWIIDNNDKLWTVPVLHEDVVDGVLQITVMDDNKFLLDETLGEGKLSWAMLLSACLHGQTVQFPVTLTSDMVITLTISTTSEEKKAIKSVSKKPLEIIFTKSKEITVEDVEECNPTSEKVTAEAVVDEEEEVAKQLEEEKYIDDSFDEVSVEDMIGEGMMEAEEGPIEEVKEDEELIEKTKVVEDEPLEESIIDDDTVIDEEKTVKEPITVEEALVDKHPLYYDDEDFEEDDSNNTITVTVAIAEAVVPESSEPHTTEEDEKKMIEIEINPKDTLTAAELTSNNEQIDTSNISSGYIEENTNTETIDHAEVNASSGTTSRYDLAEGGQEAPHSGDKDHQVPNAPQAPMMPILPMYPKATPPKANSRIPVPPVGSSSTSSTAKGGDKPIPRKYMLAKKIISKPGPPVAVTVTEKEKSPRPVRVRNVAAKPPLPPSNAVKNTSFQRQRPPLQKRASAPGSLTLTPSLKSSTAIPTKQKPLMTRRSLPIIKRTPEDSKKKAKPLYVRLQEEYELKNMENERKKKEQADKENCRRIRTSKEELAAHKALYQQYKKQKKDKDAKEAEDRKKAWKERQVVLKEKSTHPRRSYKAAAVSGAKHTDSDSAAVSGTSSAVTSAGSHPASSPLAPHAESTKSLVPSSSSSISKSPRITHRKLKPENDINHSNNIPVTAPTSSTSIPSSKVPGKPPLKRTETNPTKSPRSKRGLITVPVTPP